MTRQTKSTTPIKVDDSDAPTVLSLPLTREDAATVAAALYIGMTRISGAKESRVVGEIANLICDELELGQ